MTSSDDDVKPVHPEGEILDRVYARGLRIRRRRRALRAGSVFVALALLFAAGVGVSNLVGTTKTPAALNKSSSSPIPSSSAPVVLGAVQAPPAVLLPRTGGGLAVHASPTPSGLVCINSFDPACGKFYWYPNPGYNAPVVITIHLSSTTVQVGQTVTATVTVGDADAPIRCASFEWGDNGTYIGTAIRARVRFGRWDTPPKHPSHETLTFKHVYQTPGPHHVLYSVDSGTGGCGDVFADPYRSSGSASANLTVEGPSPSPTPSSSLSPSPSPSPSPSSSP